MVLLNLSRASVLGNPKKGVTLNLPNNIHLMVDIDASIFVFLFFGIPYLFLLKKAGLSVYWATMVLFVPLGIPVGAWIALPMLGLRAWLSRGEIPNLYFLAIPQNLLLVAMHVFMPIFSLYVIFKKTGYSGWWCLSSLIPPVALIMLWVAAFKNGNNIKDTEPPPF